MTVIGAAQGSFGAMWLVSHYNLEGVMSLAVFFIGIVVGVFIGFAELGILMKLFGNRDR